MESLPSTDLIPQMPRLIVRRERLYRRLDAAVEHPLTAIVGPAGSGKTTLVRAWLRDRATTSLPTVWTSMKSQADSEGDAARARFWELVADAVARAGAVPYGMANTVAAPAGAGGLERRRRLIEWLARLPGRLLLVVDDVDIRSHPLIGEDLALLARRAPRLRVIVLTRARLAAPGDMAEILAAELAFTRTEAAQLLQATDLPLDDGDLDVVMAHSRGWPVAVRLMAYELAATYHFHQLLRQGQQPPVRPACSRGDAGVSGAVRFRPVRAARDFRVLSDVVRRHWGDGCPPPRDGREGALSPRERVVLSHLRSLSTVDEIARDLYVSPNTLKTQLRSIYRKLGVSRRREAVTVAEQLGWFEPGPR
ncbi:regulatory protein, luxR family [Sinosporangium album]|uniref:Regulatory protein, luxR family n=1 Tax=Sinosporangium album TaxID=504805 RepID=A0A1G8FE12_9ACTN|nr:LuxR C-terminal-related transcriptional regulator [Sinosporangium album]SDH80424.1 regulatory protein, luxR family [Sinosporangium album]